MSRSPRRNRSADQLVEAGQRYLREIDLIPERSGYRPYDDLERFRDLYDLTREGPKNMCRLGIQTLGVQSLHSSGDAFLGSTPPDMSFNEIEANRSPLESDHDGQEQTDQREHAADTADEKDAKTSSSNVEADGRASLSGEDAQERRYQHERAAEDTSTKNAQTPSSNAKAQRFQSLSLPEGADQEHTDQFQHTTENAGSKNVQVPDGGAEAHQPAELVQEQRNQSQHVIGSTVAEKVQAITIEVLAQHFTSSMKSAFSNAISADGRILVARRNFANEHEPMYWSEIVTYIVALCNADDGLAGIGKVRRIIRTCIQNIEWAEAKDLIVKKWIEDTCKSGEVRPQVFKNKPNNEVIMLKPGEREFDMLMGTPNAMGVAYLLAWNKGRFPPETKIGCILINPSKCEMEIRLTVKAERDGVLEDPEKALWQRPIDMES